MSEVMTPKVLIADGHPLFREGLQAVVAQVLGACDCDEAQDIGQAQALLDGTGPYRLVLLDLDTPGMNGFNGLIALRNIAPDVPIAIVSGVEDAAMILDCITYGASGFVPKTLPKDAMAAALRRILSGELYLPRSHAPAPRLGLADRLDETIAALTPQQRRVLAMMVQGKSNKLIAKELDISESTVKAHVSAVLRKLNVHSRTQAVINAGQILLNLREADLDLV